MIESVVRLALCGPPGSGKSTVRRLSQELSEDFDLTIHHLRLADPLYSAMSQIYRLAGLPLVDDNVQDGHLLNILGVEMRRINENVLADHARARLRAIALQIEVKPGRHAVICDDMRPPDASFMCALGFRFAEVTSPVGVAVHRRRLRGDITLGSLDDANEVGVDRIDCSEQIDNSGTLDELTTSLRDFWGSLLSDYPRS